MMVSMVATSIVDFGSNALNINGEEGDEDEAHHEEQGAQHGLAVAESVRKVSRW